MERLKMELQGKRNATETAIVALLQNENVQKYAATYNAITRISSEIMVAFKNDEKTIDASIVTKFTSLKKILDSLEKTPDVKKYLALLSSYAKLDEDLKQLEEPSNSRK